MERLCRTLDLRPGTRVLDVGGNTFNWRLSPVRPDLTFLNLAVDRFLIGDDVGATLAVGRAEALPFRDRSFDLVFCNSVIEHVGTWEDQVRVAAELRRVGRTLFVQTPDRHFPIEPHYLTPFVHYLPVRVRRRLLRNFTVWGWIERPSADQVDASTREIRLLSRKEMARLFPDAVIERERFLGLSKSLIAVRR